MEPLGELLAVNHRQALEFFATGLRDVAGTAADPQELMYNASVLAHFAQVSSHAPFEVPTPASLSTVFDHFVSDDSLHADGAMMEQAAAQCLLLAGFFEGQMRSRHNIRWYSRLGAGFFHRAAAHEASPQKGLLLHMLAEHFERWRQCHAQLGRELREQPYRLC